MDKNIRTRTRIIKLIIVSDILTKSTISGKDGVGKPLLTSLLSKNSFESSYPVLAAMSLISVKPPTQQYGEMNVIVSGLLKKIEGKLN